MELVAQLAMRLSGRSDRVVVPIEHSRGSRRLSLADGSVTLRLVADASASNADEIACRVFLLGDGTPNVGLPVFVVQVQHIGRASCREPFCQYVKIIVVTYYFKKQQ